MADLAISTTLIPGSLMASAEVNQNFSDIVTWLNNKYDSVDSWANMKVSGVLKNSDGSTTDPSVTFTGNLTNGLHKYSSGGIGFGYVTSSSINCYFNSSGPNFGRSQGIVFYPSSGVGSDTVMFRYLFSNFRIQNNSGINVNFTGKNFSIGSVGGSYGGGVGCLFIPNATSAPSTNPSGGGILYVEAGALKYRGSSGTVSTPGPA
jgi:hypothetical protein